LGAWLGAGVKLNFKEMEPLPPIPERNKKKWVDNTNRRMLTVDTESGGTFTASGGYENEEKDKGLGKLEPHQGL